MCDSTIQSCGAEPTFSAPTAPLTCSLPVTDASSDPVLTGPVDPNYSSTASFPFMDSAYDVGPTAYFADANAAADQAALNNFEPGKTYSLQDSAHLLPSYLRPYALSLSGNGVSLANVGVRYQMVATPNGAPGATVPQFEFIYMRAGAATADTPLPSLVPRSLATTGGGSGPQPPLGPVHTALRSTAVHGLSAGGQLLFLFYIDDRLLRPAVADGTIPDGARGPILFSTAMLGHKALADLGLVQRGSMATLGRSIPPIVGYQMMSALLLHAAGVEIGTQQNEYGSITAGVGAVMGLKGLEWVGGRLATSAATGRLATVAASRWIGLAGRAVRGGAILARGAGGIIGGVTLVDLAIGAIYWGVGKTLDEGSQREYRLDQLANRLVHTDVINWMTGEQDLSGDRAGFLSTGNISTLFMGNIMMTGTGVSEALSAETRGIMESERDRIIRMMVRDSASFGQSVEDTLLDFFIRNVGPQYQEHLNGYIQRDSAGNPLRDASGNILYDLPAAMRAFRPTVNWDTYRTEVRTFYRNNRKNITDQYQMLADYTGGRASDAEVIRGLIAADTGSISDHQRLTVHLWRRAMLRMKTIEKQMYALAEPAGLVTRQADGSYAFVHPSSWTEAQRRVFNTQIQPLRNQAFRLLLLGQILGVERAHQKSAS